MTHQAPLSMGFFRQEYWSGLPFPSPGARPDPGIKLRSPTLQADSLLSEPPRHMCIYIYIHMFMCVYIHECVCIWGFPSGSDRKETTCNVGYLGLIPELGRSPGGGDGNPL